MSSVLLRLFSSATLDTRVQSTAPEIQAEIDRARERASYEMMPAAMIGQLVASQGIYWILQDRLPGNQLLWWLLLRQLISAVRLAHASFVLHGYLPMGRTTMRLFTAMAFCDGLAWGALGWWLTPIFRLDVAVVTISTLIGVAALAALMLQTNMLTAIVFILPMTLPNAVHAARRGDDLGYFCMIAISGMALMMLAEVGRSSRRIIEMLRLRFESEKANQAKTESLKQARVLAETRSRFLATMSHEMRTPLHGILGLLRLVQDDVRAMNNPQLMRNLTLIQGSGEHLVHVINDVLDFSKSEAGGLSVHEHPFRVHDILSELAETSQMHCADKGLALDVRLQIDPEEKVMGDPVRLRQVLLNLLGNAIKFTPRGSVGLHVWRDERSGAMVFQVCDTGIGIAASEVPRVFDAFHQAEGTYERRFGGTGLGLTISRDLCKAMGGSLRCESELGKGSVFTFELPLVPCDDKAKVSQAVAAAMKLDGSVVGVPAASIATQAPSAERTGTPGPHVLLVEDNPVNALVAQAELDRLGVRVTVVDNGFAAIECLDKQAVDLVLMDCEMPVMDGIETTRRIREREKQRGSQPVGIVALTANGVEVFEERCQAVGMNDHLLKPFKPGELAEVLNRHLQLEPCTG